MQCNTTSVSPRKEYATWATHMSSPALGRVHCLAIYAMQIQASWLLCSCSCITLLLSARTSAALEAAAPVPKPVQHSILSWQAGAPGTFSARVDDQAPSGRYSGRSRIMLLLRVPGFTP